MASLDRGAVPFGIARQYGERLAVYLTLEIRPAQRVAPYRNIDHSPTGEDALEVSISGEAWHARQDGGRDRRYGDCVTAGQIVDTLRAVGSSRALRVADLWDRWHLNGMRGNCEHFPDRAYHPGEPCPAGLPLDPPADSVSRIPAVYTSGSAWLHEPVPADVLAELRTLFGKPEGWTLPAGY